MEELTKEKAHRLCAEMWNDIAENGIDKDETFCARKYSPRYNCFACEFYRDIGDDEGIESEVVRCKNESNCPFHIYREDEYYVPCESNLSIYTAWNVASDHDEEIAKQYAIEIADLFIG